MTRPIIWRETPHVLVSQRSKAYARAHGCSLEVVVWVGRPTPPRVTGDAHTVATVERKRASDGGWDTVDTKRWPNADSETLAAARAWCETTAARAGTRGSA